MFAAAHFVDHLFPQLKDVQLNCMVNRDLTRRVKQCPLGGVAWARRAIHSDLLLALKLISALDQKGELWEYASLVQPTTGESDGEEVEQVLVCVCVCVCVCVFYMKLHCTGDIRNIFSQLSTCEMHTSLY